MHQGYIEPHSVTARWDEDGHITLWLSTQGLFGIRTQMAALLQVPEGRIKVVPLEIGGGFGGKIPIYLDPLAAVLSRKCGRPVKVSMDRKDEFEASGPTSGGWVKLKLGVTKEGRITAASANVAFEAGAFPGAFFVAGLVTMFGCYDIPAMEAGGVDSRPEPAQDSSVPCSVHALHGLCGRTGDRRGCRATRDRAGPVSAHERGQRGYAHDHGHAARPDRQ
jgi:CO/xanthine dehydrogenase Mo-binding subunit